MSLLKLSYLGTSAILCEVVGPLDLSIQGQFWALARLIQGWPGVDEVVPGMNNLMVVLRRGECDHQAVLEDIRKEWTHLAPLTVEGKLVDIPVVYGGEMGRDLEMVAHRADMALADAAALHIVETHHERGDG
uniref:carboxyltransferase domain-containing protein n=1 Tax=uncultured Caballeronia sp. TaxID=1827198 RepID=UPI0035C9CB95